jgi:hypothetical protein
MANKPRECELDCAISCGEFTASERLLKRRAADARLEAGVGKRTADGSCGDALGMMIGRGLRAGLWAGDRFGRVLFVGAGCFRGRPGPLLFTCKCDWFGEPELKAAGTGEFACSSLGAGEGKAGRGPATDGGLDMIAAAAVSGVGNCALVMGDS